MKPIIVFLIMIQFIIPVFADHLPSGGSSMTYEECEAIMGRECVCWELGKCEFTSDPFGVMLIPFDYMFGGLAIVIFWALIVGILWLRTESPQLVGLVGIAMTSSYLAYLQSVNQSASAEWETARVVGVTLFVISFGIAIYQIITRRLTDAGPN
ncbi:MAG: hypothetical protein FJ356_01600 [Thaumarchaeota archaeon]|nr:hypothetical protein [Nitrososphaerota archaeon]